MAKKTTKAPQKRKSTLLLGAADYVPTRRRSRTPQGGKVRAAERSGGARAAATARKQGARMAHAHQTKTRALTAGASRRTQLALTVCTILKYFAALAFASLAYANTGSVLHVLAALLEIAIVFFLSNLIARKSRLAAWLVGSLLLLAIDVQLLVMWHGSSYLSAMMITSLDSLEDLSGSTVAYVGSAAAAILTACLPQCHISFAEDKSSTTTPLAVSLGCALVASLALGNGYSPLFAYANLGLEMKDRAERQARISNSDVDYTHLFEKSSVGDFRERPETLEENPNIILILTEGLSTNIVEDERNIMPNVSLWAERGLSFDNYYNHTFATYRGISGQLYSGYQFNDYDVNANPSLMQILRGHGYTASFINAEPNNYDFTRYLNNMDFDEIIGNPGSYQGMSNSMSDKEAYELLFDSALSLNEQDEPFFLAMYTFGTHVTPDSPDEKFGDGSVKILNRMYNVDYQFGRFMERFEASPLAEHTLVIFTADHASYADAEFATAFPDYARVSPNFDEMPLVFYYEGIEPGVHDVEGRNSLGLAPTIIDYIDLDKPHGNCFLSRSLFSNVDETAVFEFGLSCPGQTATSKGGELRLLTGDELDAFNEQVDLYYTEREQRLALQS